MVNLRIISLDRKLIIEPSESAFAHGMGIFESIKVENGYIYFWDRHWNRLQKSVTDCFGYCLSLEHKNETFKVITRFYRELKSGSFILKLSFIQSIDGPVIYVYKRNYLSYPTSASLKLNFMFPINEKSLISGHKTHNYFENLLLLERAKAEGFYDYIRVNMQRNICETSTANCFFIKDNDVFTPTTRCGILPGIIRDVLIEHPQVQSRQITEEDLKVTEGAFITNASFGLLPVQSIFGFSDNTALDYSKTDCKLVDEMYQFIKKIASAEASNLNNI